MFEGLKWVSLIPFSMRTSKLRTRIREKKCSNADTLSKHDLLFIPIHDLDTEHWFLTVISSPASLLACNGFADSKTTQQCRIFTLDSLGSRNSSTRAMLKKYLREEIDDKYGFQCKCKISDEDVKSDFKGWIPKQPNAVDCGIYLLCTANAILDEPSLLTQKKRESSEELLDSDRSINIKKYKE
ncbi:hypothetical protein M422DRAFT_43643 [Sphaerobolus stellatus SS14]|nr:hypothetical protein M422DRAFT_43643 [Sphaerobolus stellatus SS14]